MMFHLVLVDSLLIDFLLDYDLKDISFIVWQAERCAYCTIYLLIFTVYAQLNRNINFLFQKFYWLLKQQKLAESVLCHNLLCASNAGNACKVRQMSLMLN